MLYLTQATDSFPIPLFDYGYIVLYNNIDKFNIAVAKLHNGTIPAKKESGRALTYECGKDGLTYYIIGVFDSDIGTLVHEVAHTTFQICSDVGITIYKGDSNETFCYLIDYIVNRLYRSI